jgi:hypothetical protein
VIRLSTRTWSASKASNAATDAAVSPASPRHRAAVQGGVTILMSTGRINHLEAALDTSLTLLGAGGLMV